MSLIEVHLALLSQGPAHGYDLKRAYDAWFPDAKPLPFGQVYATLGRLVRDGLAEVVETRSEGGPERTVYTVTDAGRQRVREWLAEPAPPAVSGTEDLIRRSIAALHVLDSTHNSARITLRRPPIEGSRINWSRSNSFKDQDDFSRDLFNRYLQLHLEADVVWLQECALEFTNHLDSDTPERD